MVSIPTVSPTDNDLPAILAASDTAPDSPPTTSPKLEEPHTLKVEGIEEPDPSVRPVWPWPSTSVPPASMPEWLEERPALICKYEEDYRRALAVIDQDVKQLVEQRREMAALSLFNQQLLKILEVHEALSVLYSMVWNGRAVLHHFGSERLRQLGHELIGTYDILRNDQHFRGSTARAFETNNPDESIENFVAQRLRAAGFQRKHWWIKERILAETEYMIEALKILVEPDFIPFGTSDSTAQDERPDRYVPSEVKIAVWRRDGGKCVECGSKEKLEYDHIIPVSKGGSNTERNIQLLCEKCNRKKASVIQ